MTNRTLIGETIGKYQVEESLGRGGMAEVYRAYQKNLDRNVAIKIMHAFLADEEGFLARFQREAKAMAALNHAHIVSVYDFDVQDGIYYIVMEFVGGGTLKQRLEALARQGNRLPLSETVRLVLEIADALAYAHSRGMVHRDIKPGNIMISDEGGAVLTDFGIAKILSGPSFTATGAMIGTPAYMSPEQGMGQAGDERSDLYALGVLFYQMAAGRLPYEADTPLAVILKHVQDPIPSPEVYNADLPEAIKDVIVKSMAKDPAERYQSANELGHALQGAASSSNLAVLAGLAFDYTSERQTLVPSTSTGGAGHAGVEATVLASKAVVSAGAAVSASAAETQLAQPGAIEHTEVAAPLPASPPPRKSRWWLPFLVIILLLLLVAIAGGGYLLGGGLLQPAVEDEPAVVLPAPSDTPTMSPTASPLPAATSDIGATAVAAIAATLTAEPTETALPTATETSTATPTPDLTATLLATCEEGVELVNSYTFENPDSHAVPIGVPFSMNWILKNSGTCPLPAGLLLTHVDGEGFEQGGSVTLDSELVPGQEALLTASLVAPDEAGTYESFWAILDADGGTVGSEISFEVIVFVAATATPVVTDTPTPTATPAVVEAFGFDLSVGSCEYIDTDWQCQLFISPYGGLGPYTALISDADPPNEYQGDGPFSHPILSRRCTPWVNTVTVQDDGTGQSLAESKFYDPNFFFEGGCVPAS
jgi:serine/threonine protein kinase